MFKGGGNPLQMMQMITKAKKAVKVGGEVYEKLKLTHSYHQNMVEIKTQGDLIKEINFSDEYLDLIKNDSEMASDLLSSSLNSLRQVLNKRRTDEVIASAEKLKVSKHIIDSIKNDDALGMM